MRTPGFKGLEQTFMLITVNSGTLLDEQPGLKVSFKRRRGKPSGDGEIEYEPNCEAHSAVDAHVGEPSYVSFSPTASLQRQQAGAGLHFYVPDGRLGTDVLHFCLSITKQSFSLQPCGSVQLAALERPQPDLIFF